AAVGRRASANLARPCVPEGRADPHPGRTDERGRRPDGERNPEGGGTADAGAHDLHHRTPPDPVERLRRDPARRRRPSDDRRPDRRSGRDRAAQRGVGTYAPAGDRPDSAALTMSTRVCLSASTLNYPRGGGHMWVYLNWALGLRSVGCEVFWLEGVVKG